MASDNLLNVIRDLVKRDGRLSKAKTEQDNEKIKTQYSNLHFFYNEKF